MGKHSEITIRLTKLKNILVHDYTVIDLDKMYEYLNNDLDDFDKYIKAAARFIKKVYG